MGDIDGQFVPRAAPIDVHIRMTYIGEKAALHAFDEVFGIFRRTFRGPKAGIPIKMSLVEEGVLPLDEKIEMPFF